jgi:hypothetical protein
VVLAVHGIPVDLGGPSLTDWLAAGASAFAAATTLFLVIFAWRQIGTMAQQVEVAREAASRQWYPLVYAHELHKPGPDPDLEGNDHVGCFYFLRNEGLGPALNIEHGVAVWGHTWPFGGDETRQFRSVQPGASIPPTPPGEDDPYEALVKNVPEDAFYLDGETPEEVIYWCRYESLFGDRWETWNSNDPTAAPEIRRLPRQRVDSGDGGKDKD